MNKSNQFFKTLLSRRQWLRLATGSLGILALPVLVTGCSSNSPVYYSLSSYPGKIYGYAPKVIEVRTPSLAGSLDKDRIVSEIDQNKVKLAPNAIWSDNLSSMISRTVALNLSQRLPNSHVFAQNQATSMEAEAFVEMDISRFNQDAAGQAIATISLVIYRKNQKQGQFTRLLQLRENPNSHDLQNLIISLDRILSKVSDITAQALVNLPKTLSTENEYR